jgi:alpha-tubulin suppressor-like RCC1 family protein
MPNVLRFGQFIRMNSVNTLKSRRVPGSEDIAFKEIGAGNGFSVAVTASGQVIRWGHMAFGHETYRSESEFQFEVVPELAKLNVHKLCVGFSHFLCVDENGDLWICGSPETLGLGPPERFNLSVMKHPSNVTQRLIKRKKENTKWMGRIKQVSAGIGFSSIVSEDGDLFTFGKAIALGLNNGDNPVHYPTQVDPAIFDGEKVIHASCGGYHMVAITGK